MFPSPLKNVPVSYDYDLLFSNIDIERVQFISIRPIIFIIFFSWPLFLVFFGERKRKKIK